MPSLWFFILELIFISFSGLFEGAIWHSRPILTIFSDNVYMNIRIFSTKFHNPKWFSWHIFDEILISEKIEVLSIYCNSISMIFMEFWPKISNQKNRSYICFNDPIWPILFYSDVLNIPSHLCTKFRRDDIQLLEDHWNKCFEVKEDYFE